MSGVETCVITSGWMFENQSSHVLATPLQSAAIAHLNRVLYSFDCIFPACLEGIVAKHKFSPYIAEREAPLHAPHIAGKGVRSLPAAADVLSLQCDS